MINTRVLLLNASYEPLRLITVQRAVGLMLAGKVQTSEKALARDASGLFHFEAVLNDIH